MLNKDKTWYAFSKYLIKSIGEEGVGGGGRASRRYAPIKGGLPLLGDGGAVGEEAERLRAPEVGEIILETNL